MPTVAAVLGALDAPAVPDFLKAIDRAISLAVRTLIVDLSRVDFVGISGVLALADAQDRATCNGLAMLLVPDEATAGHTLRATDMADHFHCFPSVQAAAEARRVELAAHDQLEQVRVSSAAG
ncbi:hypothetical protein GCM10023094_23610 [Rhodococcus olei]|uniref:STAS domain-containing protein n=1 Tax=Rhodococcus olei TaxID=2161675 RepID=A0ABP8P305_9NOCA